MLATIPREGPTARSDADVTGACHVTTPAGGSLFSGDLCAFAPFGHELFGWWIGLSGDYADELPCATIGQRFELD